MSDMQNIELSTPDSTVAEGSVDNTNAPGSSPRLPSPSGRVGGKRPRLIGPEIHELNQLNPVDQIDPESTTVDIVEGRTVGTQTTFPERVVMCVICGHRQAIWVLVPCGHRCVCPDCFSLSGSHAATRETMKERPSKLPFHHPRRAISVWCPATRIPRRRNQCFDRQICVLSLQWLRVGRRWRKPSRL